MNMNSGTEQATPVSALVADHQLTEALQKYARTARELGHEDDVAWALQAIRRIDLDAAQKARTKEIVAEIDIRNALATYIATVETQGRNAHVSAAERTLHNLDRNNYSAVYDAIQSLEYTLSGKIDAVAASVSSKADRKGK
jgi:hypothetical protein